MADYPLAAQTIKNELKRAGIRFVVALPDRVTSHHLLKGLIADPEFKVVQVCKEDEGISICSVRTGSDDWCRHSLDRRSSGN